MTLFISSRLAARHGFFTRKGGVSTGHYASLNCSFSSDNAALVRENRALVARNFGMKPEALLGLKQVHGADVAVVHTPWAEGDGPKADALVTKQPGLALSIITADCAPVLFYGDNGAIGAAHAGWKGAFAGVLEATAKALQDLGAKKISASIGPCIHQASYEVGAELQAQLSAESQDAVAFFKPGRAGHFWFDLPGYCASRLARVGIQAETLKHDTYAEEDLFFSYRRKTLRQEPATGHQISIICS